MKVRGLALLLMTACGGADGELSIRFPDDSTRAIATSVSVTVFEPLRQSETGDIELVTCDRVGTFPPARKLAPENLRLGGGLGRLLSEFRRSQDYPLDGDLDLDFTAVPEGDQSNPWGLAMVLIEARAAVRSADPDNGSPVATIASACTCIAVRDARARDARFDTMVKAECPTLEEEPDRELMLEPVLPKGFRIESCTESCAIGIGGGPVGGASACIAKIPCDAGNAANCFDCDEFDCPEVNDFSNVPILFSAGGATELLLSAKSGRVNTSLSPGTCTEGQTITTQVLGNTKPDIEQKLACVPSLASFECNDTRLPGGNGPVVAVSSLARSGVVLLYDDPNGARIAAYDPRTPNQLQASTLPGRHAQGVRAYHYDATMKTRPLIAVATTALPNMSEQVRLDLYEWTNNLVLAGTLDSFCPNIACAEEPCGDGARADRIASIGEADIDGDGLSDIAVAGDSRSALVVGFLSTMAGANALYEQPGCTCGQYGGSASLMELGDFGGVLGGAVDVLLATGLGPIVGFGDADRRLPSCGGTVQIAIAAIVRDIARGRFGCDPNGPEERVCGTCGHGADAVIIGGELAGFASTAVQVVLAQDTNNHSIERKKTTLALDAADAAGDGPSQAESGDINGDGFDDLALLYGGTGEVRVWLGARNGALALSPVFVSGDSCSGSIMTVADLDGDGSAEIALVCNAIRDPVLRRCVPRLTQPR